MGTETEYQFYMLMPCDLGGVKQLFRNDPNEPLPATCADCGAKLEYHASKRLLWAVHAPVAA